MSVTAAAIRADRGVSILYDFVYFNPAAGMRSSVYTHGPAVLSEIHQLDVRAELGRAAHAIAQRGV
jgi:hypothetical protein